MKVKIKNGYLVIRIPLTDLPVDLPTSMMEARFALQGRPPPEVQQKIAKVYEVPVAIPDEDDEDEEPPPVEIDHTPECMILRAQEEQFAREWPVHCRTCRAAGYIGVANGQKKACPRCIEFHLCPRCGNSALTKMTTEEGTFFTCPGCEWNQAAALSPKAEALGLQSPRWFCLCEKEKANA